MLISDNSLNVLAASDYRGIGKAWINRILHGGETVEQIVQYVVEKDPSADVEGFKRKKDTIREEIQRLGDAIDGVTGIGDGDFPIIRRDVKEGDRPVSLFYKGDINLLRTVSNNVAVIGLLSPSGQIEVDEQRVVRKIVEQG